MSKKDKVKVEKKEIEYDGVRTKLDDINMF